MDLIANDTETGGLYPATDPLLSIGAVCSWSGEKYLAYITAESQPGKTVAPDAAKTNGYTPEKWQALGARPLAVVFEEFTDWLRAKKEERPRAWMLCHNAAFDRSHYIEAERITGCSIPHRGSWLCSQVKMNEMLAQNIIEASSSSLDSLALLSGWHQRSDEHDALEDSLIALHGYQWLLKKQQESEATLRQLYTDSLNERRKLEGLILQLADYHNGSAELDEVSRIVRLVEEAAKAIRVSLPEKKGGPAHG